MTPNVDTFGMPYAFEVLKVENLFVDDAYQRPLSRFVETVVQKYDPALIGTIVVADRAYKRKERYAIVDGQTRVAAMERKHVAEAPCLVYKDLTREQEADLFARLQTERRGVTSYQRFRAALIARDPEAKAIEKIAADTGFEIAQAGGASNVISAVGALEWVYRRKSPSGPILLEDTLTVIKAGWADYRVATSGEIVRGVAYFLEKEWNKTGKDPDLDKLVRGMKKIEPSTVKHRASSLREGRGHGGGSAIYIAEVMATVYRQGGSS